MKDRKAYEVYRPELLAVSVIKTGGKLQEDGLAKPPVSCEDEDVPERPQT